MTFCNNILEINFYILVEHIITFTFLQNTQNDYFSKSIFLKIPHNQNLTLFKKYHSHYRKAASLECIIFLSEKVFDLPTLLMIL